MKFRRSKTIPLILLVYLVGMSIYSWPARNPGITYTQYWATIAITFVCIIILSYLLKRRDDIRDKNRKN